MFDIQVDCLTNGAPHSRAAQAFIKVVRELPEDTVSFPIRTITAWELFQRTEAILAQHDGSIEPFIALLDELTQAMQRFHRGQRTYADKLDFCAWENIDADFKQRTAEHYGNLFRNFDDKHYYDEAAKLLQVRLERNGIILKDVGQKRALDAGCGGGRYSFALKALGYGDVVGVDFSDINIETATRRLAQSSIQGLRFERGNVLEMPFEGDSFDMVFSNGVIHHTESIAKGVAEIARVLKPGGLGWLYIIEQPGGLHWDMVELLRNLMRPVNQAYAQAMFALLGVPTNRIFYILDHVMAPINTRSTPQQVEETLRTHGLKDIQRLTRGSDFDRAEKVYTLKNQLSADAIRWKWGVGENRYVFSK